MTPHEATGSVTRSRKAELLGVLLVGVAVLVLSQLAIESEFAYGFNQSPNNRNVSVDTRVNITGSRPDVLGVIIDNPITLAAGSIQVITCNASIRDYNGFADISNVNATFFHSTSSFGAVNDNNTHYTNSSCSNITGQFGGAFINYTCSIALNYYAMNGTWNCTVLANDSINLMGNNSNLTNISALFALNVTPLIDYGDMAMGDTSENITANVTNLGNWPINITVQGYGRNLSDGLSFVCEQGNLSVNLQRFAANETATYAEKQVLGSSYTQIAGLSINKSINATPVLNTTYWQLFLDTSQVAFGLCNGTIVFQANNYQ